MTLPGPWGSMRDVLLQKLKDLPDCDLANAGTPALTAMAELYEAVKRALSADNVRNPNAWVTASKLCARKRPELFPVRDKEVCDYLGLTPSRNYQVDWQVFQSLISDPDVIAAIDAVRKATVVVAADRRLQADQPSAPSGCRGLDTRHVTALKPCAGSTIGSRQKRIWVSAIGRRPRP
jgi:Family of unknown function (DUF6308)